jgi:hypothetical protein
VLKEVALYFIARQGATSLLCRVQVSAATCLDIISLRADETDMSLGHDKIRHPEFPYNTDNLPAGGSIAEGRNSLVRWTDESATPHLGANRQPADKKRRW